jgi:hypothetical protein
MVTHFSEVYGSNVFVSPYFSESDFSEDSTSVTVNFCVGTVRFTKVGTLYRPFEVHSLKRFDHSLKRLGTVRFTLRGDGEIHQSGHLTVQTLCSPFFERFDHSLKRLGTVRFTLRGDCEIHQSGYLTVTVQTLCSPFFEQFNHSLKQPTPTVSKNGLRRVCTVRYPL